MNTVSRITFKVLDLLVIFIMIFGSPMSAAAYTWTEPTDATPGTILWIKGDNSDADNEHNFMAGEDVHVDVIGPNGGYTLACDAQADDNGAWACEVTLSSDPALAVGEYTYTATGLTSGNVETGMFTDAAGDINKVYQHWSDEPLPGDWNNNILSANKSNYFEGEVIPHVFVYKASNNTPLTNGQSYSINVTYNYYQQNTNAGGFAYMTTYNISRQPLPLNATSPYITPTIDNTFNNGGGMQGSFYTVDADITDVSNVTYLGTSTKDGYVTITFTYIGVTTKTGIAEIYYGLYVANPGQVPDQGNGPTKGASQWTGGSLQTTVDIGGSGATSIQLNPDAIIAGQISGMKFNDLNGNSTKDTGDTGLAGWTINLCADSACSMILQTKITDSSGNYSFSVLPGTYYVREVNQTGWLQTAPTTVYYGQLVVTSTTPQYLNQDFGNMQISTAIDVEKYVWDGTTWQDADSPTGPSLLSAPVYKFTVTNNSNVTLGSIKLSDSPLIANFYADQALTTACSIPSTLAPSGTFTCYGSLPWAAGQQTDTATASGSYGGTTYSDTDDANYFGPAPHLSITKVATESGFSAVSDVIHYTIVATNDGNTTLAAVTVTDSQVSDLSCSPANGSSLAPGASMNCTASHTVTQADIDAGTFYNQACVDDGANGAAQACADVTTPGTKNPALSLTKMATETGYDAVGQTIHYTIVATNTGNTTLASVTVTDSQVSDLSCTPANGSSLTPGASMTCTASHTITQGDLDAGSFYNQACVDDGTGGAAGKCADVTTPGTKNPHLSITKSADVTTYSTVGEVITYTIVATNDGNVTLSNVTVSDPSVSGLTCTPVNGSTLAPGASMTCTATHTITQVDLDSGHYANTACVDDGDGGAAQACADKDVPGTKNPHLSITKSADPATYSKVGDVINYTIVATNDGNVTLNNVTVTDSKISGLTCTPDNGSTLAPGETITCTATHTVTQADLDDGFYTNTACVDDGDGGAHGVCASVNIPGAQNPAISLEKTADPMTYDAVGQIIAYSYKVTNTGNVTLTNAITVADDKAIVSCPALDVAGLKPGVFITCTATYTITQADLDAGSVTNIATAHTTYGGKDVPSNEATTTVTAVRNPALTLEKTADPMTYDAIGQVITYTITATNSGNITLHSVTVSDPSVTGLTCTPANGSDLAPGASLNCTATHTIDQTDLDAGHYANTACVDDGTGGADQACASKDIPGSQTPHISLTKTATPNFSVPTKVGDTISYQLVATNDGNVTLTNVSISDPLLGTLTCTPPQPTTLVPAATLTCTGSYPLTQSDINAGQVDNTATTTGTPPIGDNVTDTDSAHVPVPQSPSILLGKSVTESSFNAAGNVLHYTLVALNNGNVTLTNVSISDPLLGTLTCTPPQPTTLVPAATLTCTGSYTTTQADVDAGKVDNTATVTGKAPDNTTVTDTDSAHVPAVQSPHLSITKSASPATYSTVGDVITYTIVATNDGNVTLNNVTVTDPSVSGLTCTPANGSDLAPGASLNCTGIHTVTQADLDAGHYANTACVDDGDGRAAQACAGKDVPGQQNPAISLEKTANPLTYDAVGQIIAYSYKVTNTGNVTLTNAITVADDKAIVSCPAMDVAGMKPGVFITCTATYTITQADLDAGSVTNVATAHATYGGKDVPSNEATTTVTAIQKPVLSITKMAKEESFDTVGETIHYTIVATNDGNVTLKNVTVTDPNVSGLTCTPANGSDLAPGASLDCTATHIVTQDDIEAGHWANTACVDDGTGGADQACASEDVPGIQKPAIVVTKTADPTVVPESGGDVLFTFNVYNSGNTLLTITSLSDNVYGTLAGDDNCKVGTVLAVHTSCEFSFTKWVQGDYSGPDHVNVFTAHAVNNTNTDVWDDDDATVDFTDVKPTVDLTKSADPLTLPEPGGVFTFTLTIENKSAELVTITTLTDTNALSDECKALIGTTLAAGEKVSCTYTVTHTEAGSYNNTAEVMVTDNDGSTATDADDETVTVTDVLPTVTLDKSVTPASLPEPGGVFTFTLKITNTSVEAVTFTALTDDNALSAECLALVGTSLAAGDSTSCTYTVTHTEADNYPNTAEVTVKDNEDNPASASDNESVDVTDVKPVITVEKTANPTSVPETGGNVTFTFVVTNKSVEAVTITSLSDSIFGPLTGDADCMVGTVLPVAGTCTFAEIHFIKGDYESGISHNNTFTAHAEDNEKNDTSASDDATVTFTNVTADIAIAKVTVDGTTSGDGLNILTAETIKWRYSVTNVGDYPLSNISVTDSMAGATPVYVSGDTNSDGKLDLTETWVYEASGTAISGNYSNTGTAYGDFTDGAGNTESDTATDNSSYFGADPQIAIDKVTADGATSGDGLNILTAEAIKWRYTVTNVGNVPLSSVTVTDSKAGVTPTYVSGDTNSNGKLDLTETWIYEASGTAVTGNYNNTGTANGTFTDSASHPRTDTATDDSSYLGANPQIDIVKKTVGSNGAEGDGVWVVINDPVTWKYYVTNTGNVPLTNVTVTDNKLLATAIDCGGGTNVIASLAAGASVTCTATGTNTTPILTTYNNIGYVIGSYTDDGGHAKNPTDQDTSSYLSRPFGLLMTNSMLCSLPNNQFNLLFTPDQGKGYKLNASNPGQFYYNMFYVGPGNTTVKLILPYPWVVQGNMPIHVYNNVTFTTSGGQTCLTPGTALTNPPQTYVTLDKYSAQNFNSTYTVDVPIPATGSPNGFLYINIHLDYGLKDTTYWSKGLNDNAVNTAVAPNPTYPTIVNPTSYIFKDGAGTQTTITSNNIFKKNPGIGGLVYTSGGAPVPEGTVVTISVSTGKTPQTVTVKTDKDGWYMWSYKWTGKPAEFTISIPNSLGINPLSQKITLKANGYVEVNWNKP